MSYARHYSSARPQLSPRMMHRVGGGYAGPDQAAVREAVSSARLAERLSQEKAKVLAALHEREEQLDALGTRCSAAEREAQLAGQLGSELHEAQSRLSRAEEQLQAERQQGRLVWTELQSAREVSADVLQALQTRLAGAQAETEALKQQMAELNARFGGCLPYWAGPTCRPPATRAVRAAHALPHPSSARRPPPSLMRRALRTRLLLTPPPW